MQANTSEKKPQNPRVHANPISILFFLHMVPVFWRSYRNGFKEDNLFDVLKEHKSGSLGDRLERLWNTAHETRKKYALHLSLWKMFYMDFIITGILQGIKDVGLIIFMPYSVGQLVTYFGNDSNTVGKTGAYIFASVLVLCLFIDKLLTHLLWMSIKHMSMKMRVGCCSLVYRKSLRLTMKSLHQTNVGHIVNLLSNDVSKFDNGFILSHYLWTAPLQAAVATYILYRTIGISAISGMVFILSIVPLQFYMGKRNSLVRLKTALRTDERVRLMNEILTGIQIIKMYTWEKPFAKLVALARRFEMKSIRLHFYIESFIFSLEMFVTRTAVFLTIIIYLTLGNNINADVAYSVTAIYNVIRPIITIMFSLSIACLGEVHISILRLEEFLSLEESQLEVRSNQISDNEDHPLLSNSNSADKDTSNGRIKDISNGTIKDNNYSISEVVKARISLKNVSVKWSPDLSTNILTNFNLSIDQSQLVAVIGPVGSGKTSLLNVVLKELPITEGTLEVNGKISYASQDSWLFLGSVRQNILFGDIYDEDRYQTVVKVCALESDFKILPYGDRTIIREYGRSLSGGQRARINLARCIYKQADIYLLDDPLSAVDTKVGKQLYDQCIKKFLKDKICILVTHQLQYLQNADKIIILDNGINIATGTYNELQNSNSNFGTLLKEISSNHEKHGAVLLTKSTSVVDTRNITWNNEDEDVEDEKEALATGGLGFATYRDYFRKGGNWCIILCIFLVFIVAHAVASSGDYFISYWINSEQEASQSQNYNNTFKRTDITIIYSGIALSNILFGLAHSTVFFLFLIEASKNMHNTIFEKIVHATMNFFNQNPTGRILNRFSKDMGIVDEYIPFVLIDIVDISFFLVSTIVLSCLVNIWFSLPCAALLLALYLIRIVYIQTSRQVKRIEGITRSPIYNHTTASVNGLATIRANKAQKLLIKEYDNIQDNHNSAWYLYISSSEAFGLWIDLTCLIFIAAVVYSFLLIDIGYRGGDVGLIITLYVALAGVLQWGIFQWSELENNMTSVERILEYTKIEMEPTRPPISNLPKSWPEFGKVVFDNVSMSYEQDASPVLKNLNVVINPGEKVGIVGRTGAGKTSTISALFQFYPLTGSIIIDGVDTTKLPLEALRSKISIIPQECVLFSGTMRKNLDPFDEYTDEVLWNALEQVEIKSIIEEIPGGLNTHISEGGSNFSIGQRQLICLARSIIRDNKIILMDEATANIDSYTDALIQKSIKRNFANCTIITVAHRLHTIMDSDKVLVMDKGKVVEFDMPYELLQNKDGIFYSMVETTGPASAKHLYNIAEEKYKSKLNILQNNTGTHDT